MAGEPTPDSTLTSREQKIVKLIAECHSSHIGTILAISVMTVDGHRLNILHKLHMRDRLELTKDVIRAGLGEP